MVIKLSPKAAIVLSALREHVERIDEWKGEKWGSVYLDNARPREMSARSWAGYLSALEKLELYRVDDGYAFGFVKMEKEGEA